MSLVRVTNLYIMDPGIRPRGILELTSRSMARVILELPPVARARVILELPPVARARVIL